MSCLAALCDGESKSIAIGNMFSLVEHLKRSEPEFAGKDDLTSHDLRDVFRRKNILPAREYSRFFSTRSPVIALTYQWDQSFALIRKYFHTTSVVAFNKRYASVEARIPVSYLGSSNDVDPLTMTTSIWVDIWFNDQRVTADMQMQLRHSEEIYRAVKVHVALYDDRLFTRCWCLAELVFRAEAGKPTCLLLVKEDYFEQLETYFSEDARAIKEKCLKVCGTSSAFNEMIYNFNLNSMTWKK